MLRPALLLLATGCATSGGAAAPPADDPNCPQMVQSFDASCANPSMRTAPPEAVASVLKGMEQQRSFIRSNCRSLATPERQAQMDSCMADLKQGNTANA